MKANNFAFRDWLTQLKINIPKTFQKRVNLVRSPQILLLVLEHLTIVFASLTRSFSGLFISNFKLHTGCGLTYKLRIQNCRLMEFDHIQNLMSLQNLKLRSLWRINLTPLILHRMFLDPFDDNIMALSCGSDWRWVDCEMTSVSCVHSLPCGLTCSMKHR